MDVVHQRLVRLGAQGVPGQNGELVGQRVHAQLGNGATVAPLDVRNRVGQPLVDGADPLGGGDAVLRRRPREPRRAE